MWASMDKKDGKPERRNPLDIEAEKLRARLRLVSSAGREEEITPESCGIDPDEDWKAGLIARVDKKTGEISYPCRAHNLILILENDARWKGRLRFDEFRQQVMLDGRPIADADAVELKAWLEKVWISSDVKTQTVHEAVEAVGARHAFHPIREWLDGLEWDGVNRVDSFFADYCGAPLTAYSIAVARSFFVSAVARVMRPGCKVDTMLILEGPQGIGKSRLILALFSPQWHSEVMYEPGSPDFCQALRGKWCAEFGELAAMGKADNNRIKQVLTQTQDTYRKSYGHHSGTYPRQTIFAGTTNRDDWGLDETGLRRFLPIACKEIDISSMEPNRDQLWAEACQQFKDGEGWWSIPDAEQEQERRYQADSWEDLIGPYLRGRPSVTVTEILEQALGIKPERHGRSEQTRVGAILRRLKWYARQETNGARRRYYVPVSRTTSTI